jgi:hypothetical protein
MEDLASIYTLLTAFYIVLETGMSQGWIFFLANIHDEFIYH